MIFTLIYLLTNKFIRINLFRIDFCNFFVHIETNVHKMNFILSYSKYIDILRIKYIYILYTYFALKYILHHSVMFIYFFSFLFNASRVICYHNIAFPRILEFAFFITSKYFDMLRQVSTGLDLRRAHTPPSPHPL